jgi:hypothetical protein
MINLNWEKTFQRFLTSLQNILNSVNNVLIAVNNLAATSSNNLNRYTPYGDLIVAEKSNQFCLAGHNPVSLYNNRLTATGSATLTQDSGEILINTTANGADSLTLETNQSAIYLAGLQAEWSFGVRFNAAMTGNQEFSGGLTDFENGWFFTYATTGFGFRILKRNRTEPTATTQTTINIPQANWNIDKLDGTGASGVNLGDFVTNGTGFVVICDYTYYGYGDLIFSIRLTAANKETKILVHRHVSTGGTITADPNLPLSIRLSNNGTNTARTVFISSRQFSLIGEPLFLARKTSISRINFTNNDGVLYPAVALRRKTWFNGRLNHVNVKPLDFFVGSDNRPHRISLYYDLPGSLTGGAWGQPNGYQTNDTCLESNTTATLYTPTSSAMKLYETGVLKQNSNLSNDLAVMKAQLDSLPKGYVLILVITAIGGNASTEIASLTVSEYM